MTVSAAVATVTGVVTVASMGCIVGVGVVVVKIGVSDRRIGNRMRISNRCLTRGCHLCTGKYEYG